jgi:hypothetical protein
MRFAAIAKCLHQWPLAWLCKTLEVIRGGFYAWAKRPECERSRVDTQLTASIRTSFAESDQTYGARRVRRDLRDWGHRCGVHRVERLMRKARLEARPRRRRQPIDQGTRIEHTIAPNVLVRQFAAGEPNIKWAADFTIHLDDGGLAVRRGGTGSVLSSRGRLVDELADDRAVGDRCDADGDLAQGPSKGAAASLGPRKPIYK